MTSTMNRQPLRDYIVKSKYGAQINLYARSKADALLSAAELLDEKTQNLSVFIQEEWK